MATLPRTKSEAAAVAAAARKDPESRPVSGVPSRGLVIDNRDPGRHYVMVDKGAGGNREVICPAYYEELGFKVEYWPSFQGLDGSALEAAQRSSLRFLGRPLGRPGEPMEAYAAVLMSIGREEYAAAQEAAQAAIDPIEEAIVDPDKARASYLRAARAATKARGSAISVTAWEDQ